jgi:hypothetical protein
MPPDGKLVVQTNNELLAKRSLALGSIWGEWGGLPGVMDEKTDACDEANSLI